MLQKAAHLSLLSVGAGAQFMKARLTKVGTQQSAEYAAWWELQGAPAYLAALALALLAVAARWFLDPLVGDRVPFITFLLAIVVTGCIADFRHAIVTTAAGTLAAWYFFIPDRFSFHAPEPANLIGLALYAGVALVLAFFISRLRVSQRRLQLSGRIAEDHATRLRATLLSIADAVITTDPGGRLTAMNPAAESLTGWSQADAVGRPLGEVFGLTREQTNEVVEDPIKRVLAEGTRVGLGSQAVLNSRGGA